MPLRIKKDHLSKSKDIVERQILNTLDFLFTDGQITEIEVIQISRYVLNSIDAVTTNQDLFKHLRQFVNQYPLFKDNLQKTIIALNNSYAD